MRRVHSAKDALLDAVLVFAGAERGEVQGPLLPSVRGECLESTANLGDGRIIQTAEQGAGELSCILAGIVDGATTAILEVDVNAAAIAERSFPTDVSTAFEAIEEGGH